MVSFISEWDVDVHSWRLLQSLQSLLCEMSTEIIIVDVHAWVEGSDGCRGWSVAYRGRLFGVKNYGKSVKYTKTYFNQFRNLKSPAKHVLNWKAFDNVWQPDCVVLPTILLHNCSHSDLNCFQVEITSENTVWAPWARPWDKIAAASDHKADAGVLDPILISHIMLRLILIVG